MVKGKHFFQKFSDAHNLRLRSTMRQQHAVCARAGARGWQRGGSAAHEMLPVPRSGSAFRSKTLKRVTLLI